MRKKYLVIVAVIIAAAVYLYPATIRTHDPAWAMDSAGYLKITGYALRDYARDHDGALPASLDILYPKYTRDARVRNPSVSFGRTKMILIYYGPKRLGSAKTPVAEIRLYPSVKTRFRWRGFVLWGDLQVRLQK